jgi:hypothetical protein
VWTSEYFRQMYLIPFLELQRLQWDPYLAPYDGVLPGSLLSDAFFSYHAYRGGGRTHVKQKRAGYIRKATPVESYDHDLRVSISSLLLFSLWTLTANVYAQDAFSMRCRLAMPPIRAFPNSSRGACTVRSVVSPDYSLSHFFINFLLRVISISPASGQPFCAA